MKKIQITSGKARTRHYALRADRTITVCGHWLSESREVRSKADKAKPVCRNCIRAS